MKAKHMKTTGRKNPALIELVLVILFFALSSMVLVQVFVKAKMISQDSQAKTSGLLFAEDVIEQWKADPKGAERIFLPEQGWAEEKTTETERVFSIECDETMSFSSEEATYHFQAALVKEEQKAGVLYQIKVVLTERSTGKVLLECETGQYLPNGGIK